MNKLAITINLALLFFISSCSKNPTTLSDARQLIKEKKYKHAIVVLDNIINNQPEFDSAYLERAYALMMDGDYRNALIDYSHVMKDYNLQILAWRGRAAMYYYSGDNLKAIEEFTNLIKLDNNDFRSYCGRGIVRINVQLSASDVNSVTYMNAINFDYEGAMKDFNKAIEINPIYVEAYLKRADLYTRINNNDKALEDYNLAVQLEPGSFDAHFYRAIFYKNTDNHSKAMADFNKAIELDPQNPFAYANRGYLKIDMKNDKAGADKDFKKARELGLDIPDNEKVYNDRLFENKSTINPLEIFK